MKLVPTNTYYSSNSLLISQTNTKLINLNARFVVVEQRTQST